MQRSRRRKEEEKEEEEEAEKCTAATHNMTKAK